MVKGFLTIMMVCAVTGQVVEKPKSPCSSDVVIKARSKGFRALSFNEKISYTLDIRKCEPKELKKAIQKEVNKKQLEFDAKSGENFVGKTSSFAYCVVAIILYWVFA